MNNKDRVAFAKLISELREPQAMAYSSNPEYEDGVDFGREDSADQLEWLIKELDKTDGKPRLLQGTSKDGKNGC